jgi:hypothetical protein
VSEAELAVAAANGPPDELAEPGRPQAAKYAARVYVGVQRLPGLKLRAVSRRHALVGHGQRFWGVIACREFR